MSFTGVMLAIKAVIYLFISVTLSRRTRIREIICSIAGLYRPEICAIQPQHSCGKAGLPRNRTGLNKRKIKGNKRILKRPIRVGNA